MRYTAVGEVSFSSKASHNLIFTGVETQACMHTRTTVINIMMINTSYQKLIKIT